MMPSVKEPLAGLALLVIFGFLIWYNRPIESSPPFDPYNTNLAPRIIGQSDAYDYWLWKDPFGFDSSAIQKAIEQHDKKSGDSGKAKKKDEKKKPSREPQDLTCRSSLQKVISDISAQERSVKILAPLVRVSPDTVENKEMRTRQRYAVVAGLIESGYQPQEPDRLHFCSIQDSTQEVSGEYDMRWEHYKYGSKDKSKPDIVVTWIDSEILTADDKFPVGHPCTPDCNYPFKNLLKAISKDNEFYLFDLNNILGQDRSKSINHHIECIRISRSDKRCVENIKLIKPAGMEGETGNNELAKALADELKLRGIKKPSEEVMIIAERDSKNTAGLANRLQQSLDKTKQVSYLKASDGNPKKIRAPDKKDKNENQSADKPEHVSVIDLHQPPLLPIGPGQVDYFHRLAEEIRNAHDTVDIDKRDSGVKAAVILGSDFNDKLLIIEALRDKLPHLLILTTDLDAQMLYSKHWRSTRNLIVASHFDLRLREKTKKDENEPDERPFSQRAYQDQFPPFRDSQQTNIFYRTRSIADGNASSIDQSEITFPRIFEVGRNGFTRLGDLENNAAVNNNDSNYQPSDSTKENTQERLQLLFWIMVFLIGFHWAIRPWSNTLSLYLLLGPLAILAIALNSGMDGLGEPLSFTDGVSLWPSIFIQLIAVLLAGALFVRAVCELERNFCCLSRRYFRNCSSLFTVCPTVNERDECGPWLENRLCSSTPWLRWSSGLHSGRGWFALFVLIGTIIIYALNDVYPSEFPFWLCFIILLIVAIFYILFVWEDVSIKRWMEMPNRQGNWECVLWRQYQHRGRPGFRIARVVAMWLLFAIIETLLVYVLSPWPLPCRGSTCGWASWTGVLSFIVTMLLLFFVLDAVRLNFYWIKKLRKQHPLLGERITRENFNARYNASYNVNRMRPAEFLERIVQGVAERTQAVDKLIYYPMLCIMLMLFAKITYFDNQDLPLSKALTFGVAISVLFLSGFMLRHEANQLKLSIKKILGDLRVNNNAQGHVNNNAQGHENNNAQEIDETIRRIDAIDEGAFQPMLEQPVMQALLIVLASIGLFAGEYLKLFG